MKTVIKYAASAALAGALAISMAAPGQAAQKYKSDSQAQSRVQQSAAWSSTDRDTDQGYRAYAYAPLQTAIPSCASHGNYGSSIEYANCY
jgi:uncharacterized low-complexity protein